MGTALRASVWLLVGTQQVDLSAVITSQQHLLAEGSLFKQTLHSRSPCLLGLPMCLWGTGRDRHDSATELYP